MTACLQKLRKHPRHCLWADDFVVLRKEQQHCVSRGPGEADIAPDLQRAASQFDLLDDEVSQAVACSQSCHLHVLLFGQNAVRSKAS